MKENTYYFSHDFSARSDEKIKKLLMKHGILGYGIYWAIVEDLYQNENRLALNESTKEIIAYDLRVDPNIIASIIKDFGLFNLDYSNGYFSSDSIQRRMEKRIEKSEKAKTKAFKRWEKIKDDNNATALNNDAVAMQQQCNSNAELMQQQCNSNAEAMQLKESKGKERKGKEIKGKENKVNNNIHALHDGFPDTISDSEYLQEAITSDLKNDNGLNGITISPDEKSTVKTKDFELVKIHKQIMEIYSDWMKSRNLPVRIDASDAAAVKKMISYLSKFETVKEGKKTVVDLINYIFENWEKLSSWQQTQTQLRQINSQLPTIIETIKTKPNGKQQQANQEHYNQFTKLAETLRNSIAGSKNL